MATRAETFRAEQERQHHKSARPAAAVPHGDPTAPHNESSRAAAHAGYALETAPGRRPSRKSTRKSANRQRNDGQFRAKLRLRESRHTQPSRAAGR
jgi:hypothetical protein